MLHANELPLRHLLSNLDGKTSGPRFTGPIGKLLQNCERKTVQKLDPIEVPSVIIIDATDLIVRIKNIFLKFTKLHQVAEFRKILESVHQDV